MLIKPRINKLYIDIVRKLFRCNFCLRDVQGKTRCRSTLTICDICAKSRTLFSENCHLNVWDWKKSTKFKNFMFQENSGLFSLIWAHMLTKWIILYVSLMVSFWELSSCRNKFYRAGNLKCAFKQSQKQNRK